MLEKELEEKHKVKGKKWEGENWKDFVLTNFTKFILFIMVRLILGDIELSNGNCDLFKCGSAKRFQILRFIWIQRKRKEQRKMKSLNRQGKKNWREDWNEGMVKGTYWNWNIQSKRRKRNGKEDERVENESFIHSLIVFASI